MIDADRSVSPPRATLFGYAAVLPIAAGALATLAAPAAWQGALFHAVVIWSASTLCFLGGVRRGDSFHTSRGPLAVQMAAIFGLWGAGLLALFAAPSIAVALLLAGFAASAWLDSAAAKSGLAPRFFATFRPAQMLVPIASLVILLVWSVPMRSTAERGWGCQGGALCLGTSNAAPLVGVAFSNEGHNGRRFYF